MKVLVVYDSVYGNTEKIAQAIGNTLGAPPNVELLGGGSSGSPTCPSPTYCWRCWWPA